MRYSYVILLCWVLPWVSVQAQNTIRVTTPAAITPGSFNTMIGVEVGNITMTGDFNAFVGFRAGFATTTSQYNVFMGYRAGANSQTANENTFVGASSGNNNVSGFDNAFFGYRAGYSNTTNYNTFLGANAGYSTTSGGLNTFVGNIAGQWNQTGSENTFIGNSAGSGAGVLGAGGRNSFVGAGAGYNNQGDFNSFVGHLAGYLNTTGDHNVALGHLALRSNQTFSFNVAIGDSAGYATTNSYNVFLGARAGRNNGLGQSNTLLGYMADVKTSNLTNAAAIGANARVSVSNAIVLGDSVAGTKIGIGLTAPQFPLDVKGIINIRGNGTLKFSHLSNPNLHQGGTDQFLTVNEQGETVLASYRLHIAKAEDWSDKVFEAGYRLKPLADVEKHIQQRGYLPGIPSAEEVVRQGVDIAQLQAKLLEKIEELTLYVIELEKKNRQLEQKIQTIDKRFTGYQQKHN